MKLKTLSAFVSIFLCCAVCARSAKRQERSGSGGGLSVSELRTLVDTLPQLPGSIEAIQFLQSGRFRINRAAILTNGQDSGWQIFVFHLESSGKCVLEWKSGKLGDSFAVSSADQFQTYRLFDEQVLRFSGCAAHNCPDVFSAMLYVPSEKEAFTATSVLGKVSYAPSSDGPRYRYYKMDLDRFLAEHTEIMR